ncbi:hypothetical protein GCM10020001_042900 [Nonomuraea salmonea]
MLFVPAPAQLVEALVAGPARLRVRGEAAAVDPDVARLDGDDAVGRVREELAVVADQQDGLGGLLELPLQPLLAGHVEVVVGLVEQQGLVGAAQQRLQDQALLLAAGQRGDVAVLHPVERDAERGDRTGVPEHLELVAAGVGVVADGLRVAELGLLVVALHHGQLGLVEPLRRLPHGRWRDAEQQVAYGAAVAHAADELPHHAEPAGARHAALDRLQVAGDEAHERGLARAVGPDERRLDALADAEGDVVEQRPPVRQHVRQMSYFHVAHPGRVTGAPPAGHPDFAALTRGLDTK